MPPPPRRSQPGAQAQQAGWQQQGRWVGKQTAEASVKARCTMHAFSRSGRASMPAPAAAYWLPAKRAASKQKAAHSAPRSSVHPPLTVSSRRTNDCTARHGCAAAVNRHRPHAQAATRARRAGAPLAALSRDLPRSRQHASSGVLVRPDHDARPYSAFRLAARLADLALAPRAARAPFFLPRSAPRGACLRAASERGAASTPGRGTRPGRTGMTRSF